MCPQLETRTSRKPGPGKCGTAEKQRIKLATVNIEGIKLNIPFLIELARWEQIICIQEHWLNDYEKSAIENLVVNYTAFVRCWDSNKRVTYFKARRENVGVAIMWPKSSVHQVKRLDDGSERIIGTEVKGCKENIYIFCMYMPTFETKSLGNYRNQLDILHTLILRDGQLGTVVVCGDMNDTLISDRNNNHDRCLKKTL